MSHTLPTLPGAGALYAKAATTLGRKPPKDVRIGRNEVTVRAVQAGSAKLEAYRAICGFEASDQLPITYPQVQAAPLHMWLMLRPEFPLPLMGIVHVRNSFEILGELPADGAYDIRAQLLDGRRTHQGIEFDIQTEYLGQDGELLFRSLMTPLYRLKSGAQPARPRAATPPPALAEYRSFDVPADIGRRYAPISGDYNPIHLSALSARGLGFPRAIAHGMWSLARATALVEAARGRPAQRLSVQFRQPLFLPGKVALKFQEGEAGSSFALLSRTSDKVHFTGQLI
jgi:hypothetical protein